MMKSSFIWLILISLVLLRILNYYSNRLIYQNGQELRITTRVWEEPRVYPNSQLLIIEGLKIFLDRYPEIVYGDLIVIEGKVEEGSLKKPKLIKHEESTSSLFLIRKRLLGFYQRSLPKNDSALISGMVLGSRAGISQDFWKSLINSGTAHVVVASGMNVALVGGFVIAFLTNLVSRKKAVWLAVGIIWVYALLSGFDAPIIRATIMGSLVFLSQGLGKRAYTLRLLFLTGLTMLLVKPSWISDLGFILSFVATASLVIFGIKVDKLLYFVPKSLKIIKDGLSTSLAAQIGVAPILFFYFGQFNLASPLINAAVLWTVAAITIIGMIAGLVGLIFEPIGRLILLLAYPLTRFFITIVQLFG